jgi:hypothetical protein
MLLFKETKTLNAIRRTNKDTLDKLKEMEETIDIAGKKIKGEEIKPSKKFDDIEKTVTDLETGEVEKYAEGGLVKKGFPKIAKERLEIMAKQGLWANINRRKKLGISRPKSKTTISKEAYANMKAGFPKRKKMEKGGIAKGCGKVMSNKRKTTKYF